MWICWCWELWAEWQPLYVSSVNNIQTTVPVCLYYYNAKLLATHFGSGSARTLQTTLSLESVYSLVMRASFFVCRCLRRAWCDPAGSVRQLARKLRCSPAQRWLSRRQRRRSSGETGWRNVWVPVQGYCGFCYRSVEKWQQSDTSLNKDMFVHMKTRECQRA